MKTEAEILNLIAGYCSQAERCEADVRRKLRESELPPEAQERIIKRLVQEKFIDEARYVRSFVNDRLRFNHWGRIKICYELRIRNIKPDAYAEAIDEISESEYESILTDLLKTKRRSVKGATNNDVFVKLLRFGSSRGFEPPLIIKTLKTIIKDVEYDDIT